ncbi:MAG: HRDC domain-containing protein [Anaerolineales bacterium]|jgi:ribonuclease D|uniref:ribonuclease D n=1 Tax=Candidatus Villigracilis vicinus TaxID=3140679 RepID=UPI00313631AA|nr:HRDC domain-containing protein [Anaerolineales bacterium]MBK9781001.1 HRDC domain-containing protein [Anaerolineales bacterium]
MSEVLPPPVWVNTTDKLEKMVLDLAAQPRVAVDTESNSLHAFREQVCLLQFSSTHGDYLVDPLALNDLSLLAPIFSDPKIEKVFHAAEYDLICLRRDFHFSFTNLFDTMHAARVLGYPAVGLDKLLGDKFGIKMDKRHQKADWAERPLSQDQIHYARLDTHYLFSLRDVLERELEDIQRLHFAREDFVRACRLEDAKPRSNGISWERFAGRKDLSLRELTVVAQLCKWRDKEAERLDRPPYKVMMDDVLIMLAKNPPEAKVDLSAAGLSEKQIRLWGDMVLSAIRHGAEAPLVERRQTERKDDAVLRRLEKLKVWRKKVGMDLKVESDIILPKPYLSILSENPPANLAELGQLMKDAPARVETFGVQILKTLGVKHAN